MKAKRLQEMCIRDRVEGATRGGGVEKGEKRGQRRGAVQGKCPPVRESQEEPAWRKGERGPEERARPKKMPAGEGSHKRSRRGERGEKRPEKGAGPRKMPAGRESHETVSYTHLDVYKRQGLCVIRQQHHHCSRIRDISAP